MENLEKTVEVLNDLVKINNDRIAGYKKAIDNLSEIDADLRKLFNRLMIQSEELKAELQEHLGGWDGKSDSKTTLPGRIYRLWMDFKVIFAVNDRKALLEACEYGEDAAQKAYRAAEQEPDILPTSRALITNQKVKLLASHDLIKELRDEEKTEA
ncbi:PA2169 family four-helix-bundle protein [Parapedobacter composti]|nr:PA2169 family four-helix-bundle protein [Parapedobacter composti]